MLGLVFCICGGVAAVSWICNAGFEMLSVILRSLGKELWSVSGKWKKHSAQRGKGKSNDGLSPPGFDPGGNL